MARTNIAAQEKAHQYPVIGDLAVVTWTAAFVADGNKTPYTGKETLLAWNQSADTAYDVTLTSVASAKTARTGTLVKEINFGTILAIGPTGLDGWRQTDGYVWFAGEHADVKFAVLRLG